MMSWARRTASSSTAIPVHRSTSSLSAHASSGAVTGGLLLLREGHLVYGVPDPFDVFEPGPVRCGEPAAWGVPGADGLVVGAEPVVFVGPGRQLAATFELRGVLLQRRVRFVLVCR